MYCVRITCEANVQKVRTDTCTAGIVVAVNRVCRAVAGGPEVRPAEQIVVAVRDGQAVEHAAAVAFAELFARGCNVILDRLT